MRKNVVYLLLLALLLSGCGENSEEQQTDYSLAVSRLSAVWAGEGRDAELQRDLARWYNVNLRSEMPEPGFEGAYSSILYYDGGIMGYAEFPAQNRILPIFHDGAEAGLVHDSRSSFPIGGSGNQTVLRCMESIQLSPEEQIVIHILGERLTYQVELESRDTCIFICGEERYVCGRVVED